MKATFLAVVTVAFMVVGQSVCEDWLVSTFQKYDINFASQRPDNKSAAGNDPYLYACSSNSQCTNAYQGLCHMSPSNQPNAWFCNCVWSYRTGSPYPCTNNENCCTNICNNGYCAKTGGMQGTVCGTGLYQNSCAAGYTCQRFGDFGYCNKR